MLDDRLPTHTVAAGEIISDVAFETDTVVVKVFTLGPGGSLEPHVHEDEINVFHILEGRPSIVQEEATRDIAAPGIVVHAPGVRHGARNDTDERAVISASLIAER